MLKPPRDKKKSQGRTGVSTTTNGLYDHEPCNIITGSVKSYSTQSLTHSAVFSCSLYLLQDEDVPQNFRGVSEGP